MSRKMYQEKQMINKLIITTKKKNKKLIYGQTGTKIQSKAKFYCIYMSIKILQYGFLHISYIHIRI